jgi:hypothetical protein
MSANRGQSDFRKERRIQDGKQSEKKPKPQHKQGGGRGTRETAVIFQPKRTKRKGYMSLK